MSSVSAFEAELAAFQAQVESLADDTPQQHTQQELPATANNATAATNHAAGAAASAPGRAPQAAAAAAAAPVAGGKRKLASSDSVNKKAHLSAPSFIVSSAAAAVAPAVSAAAAAGVYSDVLAADLAAMQQHKAAAAEAAAASESAYAAGSSSAAAATAASSSSVSAAASGGYITGQVYNGYLASVHPVTGEPMWVVASPEQIAASAANSMIAAAAEAEAAAAAARAAKKQAKLERKHKGLVTASGGLAGGAVPGAAGQPEEKHHLRTAAGKVWDDPTLQDWPANDYRLFCGDLGNEVSEQLLNKLFERWGSFNKSKVVRDKRSGKSKGFGFVSFSDPAECVEALKECDGKYVGNRPIRLKKSDWEKRELVGVVGDLHIPHRSEDIPEQFKTLLQTKLSQVICTGNLCMKSTEDFVRSLAYNAHFVRGDLDSASEAPDQKTIRVGELSIGIIHGHQITPWGDTAMLANHARSMGVDVLIHGHSHAASVAKVDGSGAPTKDAPATAGAAAAAAAASTASTLLLNPGSMTGAYSPFTTQVLPSFLLLAIAGPSVIVYVYELQTTGEVSITKTEWKKTK